MPGSKRSSSSSLPSKRRKDEESQFLSLYIFVRLLGSGAFGDVNLMKNRISGEFYAVKVVKKNFSNTKTLNEISLGMKLNSQYICKVHGYHEDEENFYIIMEYMNGSNLFDFIRKNPQFFMKNPKIFWFVVESILHGLVYLHSHGIAHFDIKPENVFLLFDTAGNTVGVKLIDLGLSLEVDDAKRYFRGTFGYMAPELFHFCWTTAFPADVWSLGITAYTMLMESSPISSKKKDPQSVQQEIYIKMESLLREEIFNPFSKRSECREILEMEEFIILCLTVNPYNRSTANDLLKKISDITSQLSPC